MLTRFFAIALAMVLSTFSAPYASVAHAAVALTSQEQADLLYTREEEKVARDSYLTLYGLWNLQIFSNIAEAEQSHMDAILKLLDKYNLSDPAAGNAVGVFTNPKLQTLYYTLLAKGELSSLDALEVGGLIEETDIIDITAAVGRSQHEDITKTYETLMCGSRNHLRGFAQVITADTGLPYQAQVLPQDAVNQILASPMEKCGSHGRESATADQHRGAH
jgi:hypothetical protein